MKFKYLFATMCAALAMTSCSHEDGIMNSHQGNVHTLQATIEGGSRSAVTDGGAFSWTAGDAISVWDGDSYETYTYSGEDNKFNGSATSISGYAIYPNGSHPNYSGSGLPQVNLSSTYTYGSTNAIMLAKIEEGNNILSFKHLGGLMRFTIKNIPSDATSFTFRANSGITGNFQVVQENGANVIKAATASNNQTVTINFTGSETEMTFYVPLPVGEYTGFTITLGEKNYQTDTAVNTIERGTLLLMPTYTYDETHGLVKGEVSSNNTVNLEDGDAEATILGHAEVNVTTGNNNADAVATLNYTPASDGTSTLAISDDSAQDTESGESEGKVVVNTTEASTIASCEINAPTLTVELSAENYANVIYEEVTALTAQQTLIIGKGITVETLKLKGGNVIIAADATVNTIQNAKGYTEKTYIIRKGTLTNSPSVNNIIVVSNESEMALRMAAENGGDVTLTEDIVLNEPIVIASGKTVTLNLNGKTISHEKECTASYSMITNKGKFTITGNGKISFKDTSDGDPSFGWGSYTIRNDGGNLAIENGTIEHLGEQEFATHMICAVFQYSGSTTINDGIISTPNYRSARLWHGDMTIEGGTFDGQLWVQTQKGDPATLTIEGGTFGPNGRDGSSVFIGNNNNTVNLSVTGGTFETKIGCSDATQEGVKGKVSGGKFKESAKTNTASALIATGYKFILNETDNYYYLEEQTQSGN